MTAEEIQSIGKTEDALDIRDAVAYLNMIGLRITTGTLYNRISAKTGPQRFKRSGRWWFRKCDLDAWKKHETEGFGAYGT